MHTMQITLNKHRHFISHLWATNVFSITVDTPSIVNGLEEPWTPLFTTG